MNENHVLAISRQQELSCRGPQPTDTDHDLVDAARRGDRTVLGALLELHRHRCVDLAFCYLRNRVEAEDCVQDGLLKAYQRFDQYRAEAEFGSWLRRIVANECLQYLRAQRQRRLLYLDEAPQESKRRPVQLPAIGRDPERQLDFLQSIEVLKTEIRRMPPLLRKAVELRDVHELPMGDVAALLGITVAATKSRLARARIELRNRMIRRIHATKAHPEGPSLKSEEESGMTKTVN